MYWDVPGVDIGLVRSWLLGGVGWTAFAFFFHQLKSRRGNLIFAKIVSGH